MSDDTTFQPWETMAQELSTLPVSSPPCPACRHWNPQRVYRETEIGQQFDGVRLCWKRMMMTDFSCFSERKPLEGKYKLIHGGENGCGKLAFWTSSKFVSLDHLPSKQVIYSDGDHPLPGAIMRCESCKKFLPKLDILFYAE